MFFINISFEVILKSFVLLQASFLLRLISFLTEYLSSTFTSLNLKFLMLLFKSDEIEPDEFVDKYDRVDSDK